MKNEVYIESLWEEFAEVDIADVVVDIDAPNLESSYSYQIPEMMQNTLTVGVCVHVPFAGRETLGYVISRRKLATSDPLCGKLKKIIAIVEDAVTINPEQLSAAEWMSDHYVCDLLAALRCVAPATLGTRVTTLVRLVYAGMRGSDVSDSVPQGHIVETLRTLDGEAELATLREAANLPGFAGAYAALIKKGALIETRAVARAKTVGKTVKAYRLGAAAEVMGAQGLGRRSPQQQRILNALLLRAQQGETFMPAGELLEIAQASAASVRGLVEKGLVEATEVTVRRAPIQASAQRTIPPALTPGQQRAVNQLRNCLDSRSMQTVLLFGVTASGKTEVYLQAIAHTLAQGRNAIVLVPEIALTAQVVDIFVGRFGEQVAVLHSKLSEGERHDEWRRMQAGHARIVVGARSAIFAPVQNVGLIVLDEEHEASYKQENTPRYNAKDLARERARLSNAVLLLGSATPSLESYFASEPQIVAAASGNVTPLFSKESVSKESVSMKPISNAPAMMAFGKPYEPQDPVTESSKDQIIEYPSVESHCSESPNREIQGSGLQSNGIQRIEMLQRIDNRPLPRVYVVDLREEFKQRKTLFSLSLMDAISDRLKRKQQIILFLNRRGYAQFVLCRDCGWAARCPNCAVSLAFHSYDRSLRCHHCDYQSTAPHICPECSGSKVKAFGIGTEKVEEEVLNLFPTARVARMDRDTTARKGEHTRIVRDFRQGDADILIGTQMVAKGLDFPNVTLVGVVSADTAINMPDFRAAERTFQLLTQVAGRAGRGVQPGEVIIQTFSPEHYAVQTAIRHDFKAFYDQEIRFRQELRYPPFSRFVNLICSDMNEDMAKGRATTLAAALQRVVPAGVEVIGPSAAPLSRLKGQYRFHVAMRGPTDAPFSEMVRAALKRLTAADRVGLSIDMDPLSMS